jgi:hypothetical protein
MRFNDTSSKSGIIQYCEVLLGMDDGEISGNTTLLKQFTMMINAWYRRVNSWIWEATGTWEYDDSNYVDFPVATTDLVDGQQDYELPSNAQKIMRVEVLDSNGNYVKLRQFDESQVIDSAVSEFYKTAGLPIFYDVKGFSVLLYPKPSQDRTTLSDGLKVYFSRDISEFSPTDTTKEPGFANSFHRILPLGASFDYAMANEMFNKANYLKGELRDMVQELKNFYGTRNREVLTKIMPRRQSYK